MAAGITKDVLTAAVGKGNLQFRPGHGELLRWVDREGVPLLMFSAGIAGEDDGKGMGDGWEIGRRITVVLRM